jgi:uncharacterized MAPEG superfamily protein
MKAKQRKILGERSHRADRNFAVATIALMIFFVAAAFGAWMFGNPGTAAVNPPIPASQGHSLR